MKILSTIFFTLSLNSAMAQAVFVVGSADCAKWLKARKINQAEILEGYLQGYINGLASGRDFDFWVIGGKITPDQAFLWIDKYCTDNPLSSADTGLYRLFEVRGFQP